MEHGIDEARKVVHHLIDDTLAEVASEGPALDWKTSLTVKAHQMGLGEPRYQMSVAGPEYAPVFTARAMLGDSIEIIGTGTGTSKRKAQLAAAEEGGRSSTRAASSGVSHLRRAPTGVARASISRFSIRSPLPTHRVRPVVWLQSWGQPQPYYQREGKQCHLHPCRRSAA